MRRKKKAPVRELTRDERRFAVWHQIFDFHEMGYGVAEIAHAVKQSPNVVDDVLHGMALNRIRRIDVS